MNGYYQDPAMYQQRRNEQFSDTMMGLVNALFQIKQMKQGQENWQKQYGLDKEQLQTKQRYNEELAASRMQPSVFDEKRKRFMETGYSDRDAALLAAGKDIPEGESFYPNSTVKEVLKYRGWTADDWTKLPPSQKADAIKDYNIFRRQQKNKQGTKTGADNAMWNRDYKLVDKQIIDIDAEIKRLREEMSSDNATPGLSSYFKPPDNASAISNLTSMREELAGIRVALGDQDRLTPEQRKLIGYSQKLEGIKKKGKYWLQPKKPKSGFDKVKDTVVEYLGAGSQIAEIAKKKGISMQEAAKFYQQYLKAYGDSK